MEIRDSITFENEIDFVFDSKNRIYKINGIDVGNIISFEYSQSIPHVEKVRIPLSKVDGGQYLTGTVSDQDVEIRMSFATTHNSKLVVGG